MQQGLHRVTDRVLELLEGSQVKIKGFQDRERCPQRFAPILDPSETGGTTCTPNVRANTPAISLSSTANIFWRGVVIGRVCERKEQEVGCCS